ncbi:uncharacterized protein LOC116694104 [Etheostoma spectabile]|uniref:uncharacterized protein LOC116694104 n=1 Tax=Etheostoma spectabile TaxID=54343 RepID=UPI0013AF558A|nr:uncharacterized protein LOC116694104 [Etheostoma spectabile]
MACFAATLGVIILAGFLNLSAANQDTCDLYAVVGLQSLLLPFTYDGLANSHVLRWTHNSTIIFYREKGRVSVGKSEDIFIAGSLLLKNLQFSSAGTYRANVLNPNGTLAKTWTQRICMMDKVSKPQLTYMCDPKSSAVNLYCHVASPQGLVFSWILDEKTLTGETRQTLSISLAKLKGETSFTCSVANKVSKEKSDTVRPTCKGPPPPTLFCFTSTTVVAVLAGGVSLILLLLIIIIVLCCCHRRIKTQTRPRELRMLSVNKRESDSISPEYETTHPNEYTENRPAHLSIDSEVKQPSPVPKPRTIPPHTANI